MFQRNRNKVADKPWHYTAVRSECLSICNVIESKQSLQVCNAMVANESQSELQINLESMLTSFLLIQVTFWPRGIACDLKLQTVWVQIQLRLYFVPLVKDLCLPVITSSFKLDLHLV